MSTGNYDDKKLNVAGKIETDSDGNKLFKIIMDGFEYCFNVDYVGEKNRKWFEDVVTSIFREVRDNSKKMQKLECFEAYNAFLKTFNTN